MPRPPSYDVGSQHLLYCSSCQRNILTKQSTDTICIYVPRKSRSCCWMTRWCLAELSRQIFNKLQHTHVRSDVITLTSAINACDKGNSWQLAIHSFFWWRDFVVPNAITCTTLMSALNTKAEWQQCLCLFQFCLAAP